MNPAYAVLCIIADAGMDLTDEQIDSLAEAERYCDEMVEVVR